MPIKERNTSHMLWFDVEKRYKTIHSSVNVVLQKLWFDVEKRYKTMVSSFNMRANGCGLM